MSSNMTKQIYVIISRNRHRLEKWCREHNLILNAIKEYGIEAYDEKLNESKFISYNDIEF